MMSGTDRQRARPIRRPDARLIAAGVISAIIATATPGFAQSGSPGDGVPIPLTSLGALSSLSAEATLTADGSLRGKAMSGDLSVTFASNDAGDSQIEITGSLLGPVAAQVGGKLVSLFRPRKVSVYTVEDGTYVVVSGLTTVCVKPEDNAATKALKELSPQSLLALLTSGDVARGTLVGQEDLDGAAADHYVIDGPAFLAAAQASGDPTVQAFGQSLRTASDADLYVDAAGGYPLRYVGGFSGAYAPLELDGDFTIQVDLTGVNTDTPVTLPDACKVAIPA
jgi:hypothetical protein